MWLEAKAVFTLIAAVMIIIVMILEMFVAPFIALLLIMALTFIMLGDMMIGIKITKNHLQPLMDPNKPNEETCVYFDFAGNLDFIKTVKGPENTRKFVKYKQNASIINDGDYPVRTINGNRGFIGHEDYDRNVNLEEAEALDKVDGEDIKEIYSKRVNQRG